MADDAVEGADVAKAHHFTRRPDRRTAHAVGVPEMEDEVLFAAFDFGVDFLERERVLLFVFEMAGIGISERAVGVAQFIGNTGAGRDLGPFGGSVDQITKSSVEAIKIPKLFKRRAGKKTVRVRRVGERKAECGEPVVIVVCEAMPGGCLIGDHKSARAKQLHLLLVSEGGFGKRGYCCGTDKTCSELAKKLGHQCHHGFRAKRNPPI